jgi:hypothetical protein
VRLGSLLQLLLVLLGRGGGSVLLSTDLVHKRGESGRQSSGSLDVPWVGGLGSALMLTRAIELTSSLAAESLVSPTTGTAAVSAGVSTTAAATVAASLIISSVVTMSKKLAYASLAAMISGLVSMIGTAGASA